MLSEHEIGDFRVKEPIASDVLIAENAWKPEG